MYNRYFKRILIDFILAKMVIGAGAVFFIIWRKMYAVRYKNLTLCSNLVAMPLETSRSTSVKRRGAPLLLGVIF